jgi:hypothetical protein
MRYECDCGATYATVDELHACADRQHGGAVEFTDDEVEAIAERIWQRIVVRLNLKND